jgi:tetratricopeptide (TPR) repeat protein
VIGNVLFRRVLAWARLALAVLGSILVTAPASAQSESEAAKAAFQEGKRAYNLGRWEEALAGFEKAYKLSGDTVLLFNVAQAHRMAGHLEEALVSYRAFLREQPRSPNRGLAESWIAAIEAKLRARKLDPAAPGAHQPPALGEPGPAASATPAPPIGAPARGRDGRPERASADLGLTRPGPGAPERHLRTSSWVGLGVTAALAGGTVAAGLAVRNRFAELRDSCGQTVAGCSEADVDSVKTRVLVTNVLLGLTGASAVLTGLTFVGDSGATGVAFAGRF